MSHFKVLGFGVLALCFSLTAGADSSANYEAEISEIQLAYQLKDYPKANTLTESLLQISPTTPEALEMKALLLAMKNDRSAVTVFDKLIEQRKREGKPKDVARYEVISGRLAYRLKDPQTAIARLTRATKEPGSAGGAYYYLGTIQREQGDLEAARESFHGALSADNLDIHPLAQLQLSQIDAINRNSDSALRGFVRARGLAGERLMYRGSSSSAKDLALQVQKAAGKELATIQEAALLVNAGLMTGYDSNVLSVPNGSSSGGAVPAASSMVSTLNYGVVYATSPAESIQILPSYRGNFNYNFNNDTRNAQFLLNDLRVNITKDALEPTSYGLKVGAIMGFQYQVDPETNNGRLGAYSLMGSIGPYIRTPFNDSWTFVGELYFQPKKMYLDDSFSVTLRESGWEQYARAMLVRTSARMYWNPGVAVSGAWTQTSGEEFRGRRVALDFGNTFNFSPSLKAGMTLGVNFAFYPDRLNGKRQDQSLTFTTTAGYRVTDEFNLLTQITAMGNFSNVSAYRYNRLIASIGGNYSF